MTRWSPTMEFARLFNEMDRLLADVTSTFLTGNGSAPTTLRPAVDLYDTGDELVMKAVVPGVKPGTLDVQIEQNTLHLSGEFGHDVTSDGSKNWTWYRREIGSGRFAHSIVLPVPIEADRAEATYEDGILTLRMPKAEQARSRKIEVRGAKALASSLN
ncbi:MAG: Hsp20/alpha crystallin family protein [Sphaerobacter sp.]|nr:Hsp20/alpha crystallin family protein [Sphaerobacter sp.]